MSKLDASSLSVKGRKANLVQAGVRSISRPAPGTEMRGLCECRDRDAAVRQAQDRPKVVGRAEPTPAWELCRRCAGDFALGCLGWSHPGMFRGVSP